MTKDQHPITPPPELRSQWFNETPRADIYDYIIEKAAQWGADQELEACEQWLRDCRFSDAVTIPLVSALHAARRPLNPPETIEVDGHTYKLVR